MKILIISNINVVIIVNVIFNTMTNVANIQYNTIHYSNDYSFYNDIILYWYKYYYYYCVCNIITM